MDDEDGYFGESVAATYDDSSDVFDPGAVDAVADALAGLAGQGRALELGIGTGRIALPLARRGVPVHGIDLSRAMVARLRAKPGGDAIGVTIGDFATIRVDGTFSLAYLVFNTIMNLTTQDAQVVCFRNVAAHLEPGGRFVIEVRVPELRRLPPGQNVLPWHVSQARWGGLFVRRRHPGDARALRRVHRRPRRVLHDAVPVCLAGRARPDGPAGRDAAARPVGRMDAGALHQR